MGNCVTQTCQLTRIARVTHAFCYYLTLTRRLAYVTRILTLAYADSDEEADQRNGRNRAFKA